jgi:hypothetical protein
MAPKKGKRKRRSKTKNITPSVTLPEPSPVLASPTEKRIFLDDPAQTQLITINQIHVEDLKKKDYLSTLSIDYLVQRSVNIKEEQRTVIASCLSMTLMKTFLEKDWDYCDAHQLCFDELQKKYQYYSFGEFCCFCLVCIYSHYYVISLKFIATDLTKRIFSVVKVYDSLNHATEESVEKGSIHAD